jgi:hypothetical protein
MATKEVWFDEYCKTCEHCDKSEGDYPCCDCLNQPYNNDSHKPIMHKEKAE